MNDAPSAENGWVWSVSDAPDESLIADWRDLLARAPHTPFQDPDWLLAMARADKQQPVIVSARSEGRLVALFPLAARRQQGARVLRWLGDAWSDYNCPLVEAAFWERMADAEIAALWISVQKAVGGVDALILRKQPEIVAGLSNPFARWNAFAEATGAHRLNFPQGEWDAVSRTIYSSVARKRIRQGEGKLSAMGTLACSHVEDPDNAAALVETLLGWKSAQLAARGGRNPFASASSRTPFSELARHSPELVRIYALTLDGEPLAVMLGLASGGVLLNYQMAYAAGPNARFSPGRIMLSHIFRQAIASGVKVFDFGLGDESYKIQLCDEHLGMTSSCVAFTALGRVAVGVHHARVNTKRWVKSNPRLLGAVYRARAMFTGKGAPAAEDDL